MAFPAHCEFGVVRSIMNTKFAVQHELCDKGCFRRDSCDLLWGFLNSLFLVALWNTCKIPQKILDVILSTYKDIPFCHLLRSGCG